MEATPKLDARGRKLLRIIAKDIIGMKPTIYRRGPDGTMIEVIELDAFKDIWVPLYRMPGDP